jgi:hypothetical protein
MRRASASTIRLAACPSPNGLPLRLMRSYVAGSSSKRMTAATMASGDRPTSWAAPAATPSERSVCSRSHQHRFTERGTLLLESTRVRHHEMAARQEATKSG